MAKRFLIGLVLLLTMAIPGACGGTNNVVPPEPEPPASDASPGHSSPGENEPTEEPATRPEDVEATPEDEASHGGKLETVDPSGQKVTFLHNHTGEQEEELLEMVDAFNSTNTYGITVIAESAGSLGDIYNRIMAGISSGDLPELVVANQSQAASYQRAGGLVDLTPYINHRSHGIPEEDREDLFAALVASDYNQHVDAQLGFPSSRSMEVLYYNRDLIKELGYDEPPSAWAAFQEMACAAKEAGYMGYQLSSSASRFASMIFSRDGDLMTSDGIAYALNSPAAIETMVTLQALFEQGCLTLTTESYGDRADFGTGKLLFSIASTAELPFYEAAVNEGYGGEWSIAAIPHTTPRPVQNSYGPSISVSRTTPEKQLAAWIFLAWFTRPGQQARWARTTHDLPVRRSAAEHLDDYFTDNPTYEKAFDLLPYSRAEPAVGGYNLVRELIQEMMVEIVMGGDAAETLGDVNAEANHVLEDFNEANLEEALTP